MIKLQDITFRDLKDIARLTSQYSVMKYIGDGRTWDFKKVKKFIKYCQKESRQNDTERTNYYYKIVENNKFIGIIGFHTFLKFKNYYLSVYINPKYQGKGVYSNAMKLLLKCVAKHKPNVKYIVSLVYEDNEKMNAISRKKYEFNGTIVLNNSILNEYKIAVQKSTKKKSTKKKSTKKKSTKKKSTKKKSTKKKSTKKKSTSL
jgi:RimJ/RimL family protein N-acetyltransferase